MLAGILTTANHGQLIMYVPFPIACKSLSISTTVSGLSYLETYRMDTEEAQSLCYCYVLFSRLVNRSSSLC